MAINLEQPKTVFNVEPKFEYTDQLPQITNLAPQLEKICKEIERDIHRGGVAWYQRTDGSICEELDNEREVRKLLKPRVKRIKIDTWEE